MYFLNYTLFLLSDGLRNIDIVYVLVDSALHHSASVIVLDVAFPSLFGHRWLLHETLLSKVFNGVIVSICQKIVQILLLSVVLQFVHQARSVALHLL